MEPKKLSKCRTVEELEKFTGRKATEEEILKLEGGEKVVEEVVEEVDAEAKEVDFDNSDEE